MSFLYPPYFLATTHSSTPVFFNECSALKLRTLFGLAIHYNHSFPDKNHEIKIFYSSKIRFKMFVCRFATLLDML